VRVAAAAPRVRQEWSTEGANAARVVESGPTGWETSRHRYGAHYGPHWYGRHWYGRHWYGRHWYGRHWYGRHWYGRHWYASDWGESTAMAQRR
jgi:hypothetical protein